MIRTRHLRWSPLFLAAALLTASLSHAQQTLGGITGTVTDPSGSALPDVEVNAVAGDTKLTRNARSNAQGTYTLNDLPIGPYTLTFRHDGFTTQRFPGILVQADRTVTLPAQLAVGAVNESVTVDVNPLLNAVDTTNGYVLDKQQIESIPLPTGSFTGVAILSPGVNAELPGGTGANSGLGNQPIWANGQRDTSNSFSLNGIDASNLFNGKSTSQVGSARVINSTGVSTTNKNPARSLRAGGKLALNIRDKQLRHLRRRRMTLLQLLFDEVIEGIARKPFEDTRPTCAALRTVCWFSTGTADLRDI